MTARKLTSKQEAYKNARIAGLDPSPAYDVAYPTHKMSRNAVAVAAQKLENHPMISLMIKEGREKATERAIVTTQELARLLLAEGKGEAEDSTPASRVTALKALTDFTGGFDNNTTKTDNIHSGLPDTITFVRPKKDGNK